MGGLHHGRADQELEIWTDLEWEVQIEEWTDYVMDVGMRTLPVYADRLPLLPKWGYLAPESNPALPSSLSALEQACSRRTAMPPFGQPIPSSENPASRQAKLTAGVTPLVSPAGENVAADPSSRMIVTAPATRPALVQVFEPAQSQDQTEVVLEEFTLDGGETVEKEYRSATAAFRFLPLTEQTRLELDHRRKVEEHDSENLTRGQEGFVTPETADEMEAGSARQQELEEAEEAARESPAKRRAAGGAERAGTAEGETSRGEEDAKGTRKRRGRGRPRK